MDPRDPHAVTLDEMRSKKVWAIVERHIQFDPFGGCWLYGGAQDGAGYGISWFGRAHRVSWQIHNGPIPEGLVVMHRCDVTSCINPAHLQVGTPQENNDDKMRKGRGRSPCGEASGGAKLTSAQVMAIRLSRAATKDLVDQYGVSQTLVDLIRNGKIWRHLPCPPRPPRMVPRGEANRSAKLTEAAVIEIRRSSMSSREAARRWGVSHTLIKQVRGRKIWTHVP